MTEQSEIPDSAAAITPRWLSGLVSQRFPGASARAVEVVDAHSGTTGRARLRVRWREDAGAPEALFAKLCPSDPISRAMVVSTGMGRREARFYASLAEEIPVRVPAPVGSVWSDDGSAYCMLIEDLAAAGCAFPASHEPEADRHAWAMMDSLATLHAKYWESPRFAGDLSWIEPPMRHEMGPTLVKVALEQFADVMPNGFRGIGELYVGHTDAVCDRLDDGGETLVHGDPHLGNAFVDGDRVGLLDWACTSRAPGLRDVAYYLCSSTSVEFRRAEERALLRRYLDRLAAEGGPALDADASFVRYRELALCSWVAASVTAAAGSRMQSIEIGRRAMERATAAIIDFDTERLLRAALSA